MIVNIVRQVLLTLCWLLACICAADFILLGSNGDLAKKYMWQAVFDLYTGAFQSGLEGTIYAAYKGSVTDEDLITIIEEAVEGQSNDKKHFIDIVQSVKLEQNSDFFDFCWENRQLSRVFYLAIPSTAYKEVLHSITTSCVGTGVVDVVLEKPIGSDSIDFNDLSGYIQRIGFSGFRIHFVDHYSAKRSLIGAFDWIWPKLALRPTELQLFLLDNNDLNSNLISYAMINGIVPDVVQNHASVVLSAFMFLFDDHNLEKSQPTDLSSVLQKFAQPLPLYVGHYDGMLSDFRDIVLDKDLKAPPTAALFHLQYDPTSQNNSSGDPVEIFIAAGKSSKEKLTYLRIAYGSSQPTMYVNLADPSQSFPELVLAMDALPGPDCGNVIGKDDFVPHCRMIALNEKNPVYREFEFSFGCNFTDSLFEGQNFTPYSYILDHVVSGRSESPLQYRNADGTLLSSRAHVLWPNEATVREQWRIWGGVVDQIRDMDPVDRQVYERHSTQLYNTMVDAINRYKGAGETKNKSKLTSNVLSDQGRNEL